MKKLDVFIKKAVFLVVVLFIALVYFMIEKHGVNMFFSMKFLFHYLGYPLLIVFCFLLMYYFINRHNKNKFSGSVPYGKKIGNCY